jgi:hypothetical protein
MAKIIEGKISFIESLPFGNSNLSQVISTNPKQLNRWNLTPFTLLITENPTSDSKIFLKLLYV